MSAPIRSFIAVPLTAEIHLNLANFIRVHRLADYACGFRAVKTQNIHLTLKFLGDIEASRVRDISEKLEEQAKILTSFSINLRSIGAFPGWKNRPRVVWVGVQPVEPILRVFQQVDMVTAALGFPSESRPFSPHLTLARINQQNPSPRQAETISRLMNLKPEPVFGEMTVNELVLFRSVLQPAGPLYSVLSRHHFSD